MSVAKLFNFAQETLPELVPGEFVKLIKAGPYKSLGMAGAS